MRSAARATSALRAGSEAIAGPSRLPATFCASARRPRYPRSGDALPNPIAIGSPSRSVRYNSQDATAARQPPAAAQPLAPHQEATFRGLHEQLSASQPCFGCRGDEVSLLTSPDEFRKTLLDMFKRAKRRILISSLYIGASQAELIDTIRGALKANPHLRATFILDYHRSTRLSPQADLPPSTAHLLLPLIEEFGDRAEVWLYRSPKLRGIMERIVPARFDEGWGTWHGKWYCADDEVVISGANLAKTYFTNRQDRYIHFRNHASLLSYLSSLTRLYTHYSYLLTPSPPLSAPRHHLVPLPNPEGAPPTSAALIWPVPSIHPRQFHQHALATLTAFQNAWKSSNASRSRRVDVDTWFWPVIQAGVLGLKEEEAAMDLVWRAVNEISASPEGLDVEVDLTSGYFGLYKAYKRAIIQSPAPVRVIAASPEANGFFGSKGLSRLIPEGYTLLESRFHRETVSRGRGWDPASGTGVRLKEWNRPGWTYHSKGVWLSPSPSAPSPGAPQPQNNPFMTFVGSSNLSTRSLTLDTELSMVLMTGNNSLRKALGNEVRGLDKYAVQVGEETWKREDRKVSWLAWLLVALGVEGML